MKPLPPHCDAAHTAITTELVRLTLPHDHTTDRPALEAPLVDPTLTPRTRRKRR